MAELTSECDICVTSVSQRPRSPRRVTSFTASCCWFVDGITLAFSDGTCITYGAETGGTCGPWQLGGNEFLVAVEQLNHAAGYLGSCITFKTSQDRSISVKKRPNKRKQREYFEATAGHHIVGLTFMGSRLVQSSP